MVRPSSCPIATAFTPPVWPVSGSAERAAGGRVPHPHRPVVAAGGDDGAAVQLPDRHRVHLAGVAGERVRRRAPVAASHTRTVRSSLPETMMVRPSSCADRHRVHLVGVAGERVCQGAPVAASHTRTVRS